LAVAPIRVGRGWVRWLISMLLLSSATLVATLPITLWHFSRLAPCGLIANLAAVPLAEVWVLPVGLAGTMLGSFLGDALLWLAAIGAQMLADLVRFFAALVPEVHLLQPSPVAIAGFYLMLWAIWRARRQLALSAALVTCVALGFDARPLDGVRVTFLDVGQGDATVLEIPSPAGRRVVVIDGGGAFDPEFDPGKTVLAPFLWRRGISRIDLMVLTHPHPDHANGLPSLAERFEVGRIWQNGAETHQPGALRLAEVAMRRGIPLELPSSTQVGDVTLTPLGPLDGEGALSIDPTLDENDQSIVLRVDFAGVRLLFAGDAQAEEEERLVAKWGATLHADVLKVPHHGSKTSSTPLFAQAVHPTLAVAQLGEHNRWGFPHPEVVARYPQLLRTDRDGAVTLHVDRAGNLDWHRERR
jgi:competence protein ComEC